MRLLSRSRAVILVSLLGAACSSGDDGNQNANLATTIDMADYVIPSCASSGQAWQIGSEQFRVVPMGMQNGAGRFVIMKSTDGSGYEEWSVDASWLRIRADTTWAYELPDHTWCDVKCGTNDASNCQQRWNTNPSDPRNGINPTSPWAFTLYSDPSSSSLGAPIIPRTLKLPMNGTTQFSSSIVIGGARRDTCATCSVNFGSGGQPVGRTVNARRLASSHGFQDVVELQIASGPGAGEVYDYARGQGWIGFNGNFASAQVPSSTLPVSSCAGFVQGSICAATGGNSQPPPVPTTTTTSTSTSNPPPPPPPTTTCACNPNVNNFCLYGANAPGCAMTAPGGYCDPNGDGNFSDADWVRGYNEYQQECGSAPPPPPPPPPTCACNYNVNNFCLYAPNTSGCAMTAPGGYCDPNGDGSFTDADWVRGYNDFHQQCP